ncbi:MAG: hypothetical protein NTY19_09560 [Planctomycetota bacterium]|nr:hypothetical protein [Planctomycetota bacterium]
MKKSTVIVTIVSLVAVVGISIAVAKSVLSSGGAAAIAEKDAVTPAALKTKAATDAANGTGGGMTALDKAAQAKRYLFVFGWKEDNDQTTAMRKVFDQAMTGVADRADAVVVKVDDPDERDIVEKFQLKRAPLPLVLAVAPSGAIMGGFPTKFSEQDLINAFGTPSSEQVMKTLQDSKLVLLCVQNAKTKSNEEALQGVRDFEADSRYTGSTKVVMLDPTDSAEASFLKDLKIDPKTEQAVTVLIAPPGVPVIQVEGAVTKDVLADALQKASSACAGGSCGPSGCGPK